MAKESAWETALSLADMPTTVRLWRQRKTEFSLSIAAFLGVALIGVLPGIAIAVALSILDVFRRAWRPYDTVLGRVEGLRGFHDTRSYPEAAVLPGLVIYRFDSPLFFARPQRSATRSGGSPGRNRRPPGSWWPPSRSPTSTRPPPTSSPT
jgi:MFS superfamily sulfate permease-like transporter